MRPVPPMMTIFMVCPFQTSRRQFRGSMLGPGLIPPRCPCPENEPLLDFIVRRNCALSKIELHCPEVPVAPTLAPRALAGVPSTGGRAGGGYRQGEGLG